MIDSSAASAHVLIHGLVDSAPWTSHHEGPYTRAAKLAILNVLSANDLCQTLFGKPVLQSRAVPLHGRSLLAGAWLQRGSSVCVLAEPIAEHAMDRICGHWATRIASDERLRYCPRCMDNGFQSVVYQIDGIERCPLHGEPLLDTCVHCGAPTPAYAVTNESMSHPLRCPRCAQFYSAAWTPSHPISFWKAPKNDGPIASIYTWLKRLSIARIEWPELAMWEPDPCSTSARSDLRKAVFDVLVKLLPLELEKSQRPSKVVVHTCSRSVRMGPNYCVRDSDEAHARVPIYKAIRRYIQRRLKPRLKGEHWRTKDAIKIDWLCGSVLTMATSVRPELHGWLVWRHRFEEGFRPDDWENAFLAHGSVGSLKLRPSVLSWPVHWSIDAEAWGHFVLACFHEDVEAARGWHRGTATGFDAVHLLGSRSIQEVQARRMCLEQLAIWKHRLSPKTNAWPGSLTQLIWSRGSEENQYLALVGTAHHGL